jgi:hypothetical protein
MLESGEMARSLDGLDAVHAVGHVDLSAGVDEPEPDGAAAEPEAAIAADSLSLDTSGAGAVQANT